MILQTTGSLHEVSQFFRTYVKENITPENMILLKQMDLCIERMMRGFSLDTSGVYTCDLEISPTKFSIEFTLVP